MKKLFTKEQQAILMSNPYTLRVSEHQIKFTLEFKRFILNELNKPGITVKKAMINAGYDPDILGTDRINGIVRGIRKQAASPKGLHETGASKSKLAEQDLSKKRTSAAIQELQRELLKTQQELAFVKKILQLPPKDDGTP